MRTVILGETNPHRRGDPLSPDSGAGMRLALLALLEGGLTIDRYLSAFQRVNLLEGPWEDEAARAAGRLASELLEGRRVLVLGRKVWAALRLPGGHPILASYRPGSGGNVRPEGGTVFWLCPHPSGRNRQLNDPAVRRRFGNLLRLEGAAR